MVSNLSALKYRVKADDMTRHGAVMVAFGLGAAFFNYLYQLSMGWLLTPEDYGVVISLMSLLIICSVFSRTVDTTVTRFVSREGGGLVRVGFLWHYFLRRTLLIGLATFICLAALTPVLVSFLHLDSAWYPIILFSSLVLTFAVYTNLATLRGLQRFVPLGIGSTLWAFLRVAIAVGLVYAGFKASGALVSFLLAYAVVFFVTRYFLKDVSRAGGEEVEVAGLRSYTALSFVALFAFTVLVNADVVLARHFLSAAEAGTYSAISVMGKLVYFVPGGIAIAMFPKTASLTEGGGAHRAVLHRAMALTVLLSGAMVVAFWLFPDLVVGVLFMGKYPLAVPHLFRYGLAMALFAIASLLMFYLLSVNRTRVAYPLAGAMAIQVVLMALFHSSIEQVVDVVLISAALALVMVGLFNVRQLMAAAGGAAAGGSHASA